MRRAIAAGLAGLLVPAASGGLKPAAQQSPSTPRLSVREVSIDVLVTDKRTGARVRDLELENFVVFDNNHPVELSHFRRGSDRPLAIVFLIDIRENTTRSNVPHLRSALKLAFARLDERDQVAVMDYYGREELVQELTRDRARVLDALSLVAERQVREKDERHNRARATGNSSGHSLATALLAAMAHAQHCLPQARIALIAITDDLTITPRELVEETAKKLNTGEAMVNGLVKVSGWLANVFKATELEKIYTADPRNRNMPINNLDYYVAQTGGSMVRVDQHRYGEAFEQVIGDLQARYNLGFMLDDSQLDGHFHSLKVDVTLVDKLSKGRQFRVRARRGYLAPREQN